MEVTHGKRPSKDRAGPVSAGIPRMKRHRMFGLRLETLTKRWSANVSPVAEVLRASRQSLLKDLAWPPNPEAARSEQAYPNLIRCNQRDKGGHSRRGNSRCSWWMRCSQGSSRCG